MTFNYGDVVKITAAEFYPDWIGAVGQIISEHPQDTYTVLSFIHRQSFLVEAKNLTLDVTDADYRNVLETRVTKLQKMDKDFRLHIGVEPLSDAEVIVLRIQTRHDESDWRDFVLDGRYIMEAVSCPYGKDIYRAVDEVCSKADKLCDEVTNYLNRDERLRPYRRLAEGISGAYGVDTSD